MARPIDEFLMAWTALSGLTGDDGWRSIPVAAVGPCVLMAGRHLPGNEEAVLAGFASARLVPAEKLPEGRGFEVSRLDSLGDSRTWIALTRKSSGSPELFAAMVADVVRAMDAVSADGEERVLRTLLARVRAWQEFMRRGEQALSPEDEVGLAGELCFLGQLLSLGLPPLLAVSAWVGPLDGIQDFEFGSGAVEVKATLASRGFLAKIGSLEQLDDSVRQPLFVAAVRLSLRDSGTHLPGLSASVRGRLEQDVEAARMYDDRLLAAGFHPSHATRYSRQFHHEETRVFEVDGSFPRLVPGTVPDGVRRVQYEIDLDQAGRLNVGLAAALSRLGAS
jgi:hypothetical protein